MGRCRARDDVWVRRAGLRASGPEPDPDPDPDSDPVPDPGLDPGPDPVTAISHRPGPPYPSMHPSTILTLTLTLTLTAA